MPKNAYVVVQREALATNALDPVDIYASNDIGQLFFNQNDHNNWEMLADYLSPIMSVETTVV